MIEEEACVEEVGEGSVWVVKSRPAGSCSACTEVCPSSIARGFFDGRRFRLQVESNFPVFPGDKVLIGIADEYLTQVSFRVYLFPLLCFLSGALAGMVIFGSDLASAAGGFLGLGVCLAAFKSLRLSDRHRCQPVIIRKLN